MTDENKTPKARAAAADGGERLPQPPDTQAASLPDDEEIVASAEDIEAFMLERRKAREQKKQRVERENPEAEEFRPEETASDPYLDPDPDIPWERYEEPLFLSRGCRRCPKCYVPVAQTERQCCSKVTSTNWMNGIRRGGERQFECVEVRFKNNHKDFYRLPDGLELTEGDVVAVEGQPGHDIGIVCLTGELCRLQMRKHRINPDSEQIKRVFRRAKENDIERWEGALKLEHEALIRTRRIVADMGLEMKVNDVEFQGDQSKAIFYYTADARVDFRELIKVLAEEFRVRVEMKQIGVRQEAGKVGGLGTCGRELCCSTWLTTFKSVTTGAAKMQQIMPNPQKLAGQCGKLKCCLNFEYEVYADAMKNFPPAGKAIRFKKGLALYKKTDVFRGVMWYAYEGENDLIALRAEKVKELLEMNQRQEYPETMEEFQVELMSTSALEQESTGEEVEREMQRLMEGGNGVVGEERPRKQADGDRRGQDRHQRQRNDRADRRPDRNRADRQGRPERKPQGEQADRAPRQDGEQGRQRQPRAERRQNPNRREGEGRRGNNRDRKE
ncbi:MAG: hypothetical protein IJ760_02120 [Bacteroidales bacterium]|nr:hypothetical protein [Bacteroidales bacterium]